MMRGFTLGSVRVVDDGDEQWTLEGTGMISGVESVSSPHGQHDLAALSRTLVKCVSSNGRQTYIEVAQPEPSENADLLRKIKEVR